VPSVLWDRIAAAPHVLAAFDYDGTLAPLRVERDEAFPAPGAVERLNALAALDRATVAVVSGRRMEDLVRLLGAVDPRIHLVAEHGWERMSLGKRHLHELPAATVAALSAAAEALAREVPEARIERKRRSIVLHVRGLPSDVAAEHLRSAQGLWKAGEAAGLRSNEIDGGLELRTLGRDKGDAVRELLDEAPPGSLGIHVGDDRTDEDAFLALGTRGFGLKVSAAPVRTAAAGRLASPAEVVGWMERLERGMREARAEARARGGSR